MTSKLRGFIVRALDSYFGVDNSYPTYDGPQFNPFNEFLVYIDNREELVDPEKLVKEYSLYWKSCWDR